LARGTGRMDQRARHRRPHGPEGLPEDGEVQRLSLEQFQQKCDAVLRPELRENKECSKAPCVLSDYTFRSDALAIGSSATARSSTSPPGTISSLTPTAVQAGHGSDR